METRSSLKKTFLYYILPFIFVFLIIGYVYNRVKSMDISHSSINRTAINPPDDWAGRYNMNQAEVFKGLNIIMLFSGQASLDIDPDAEFGLSTSYPGDIRKQMKHTFGKIEYLLEKADMSKKNILHIRFYTTDVDGFLANYDVYSDWIKPSGIKPTQTLLGVKELALPQMLVEIEVTAGK